MKAIEKKTLSVYTLNRLWRMAEVDHDCDAVLQDGGLLFRIRRRVEDDVVSYNQFVSYDALADARNPFILVKRLLDAAEREIEREIAYNAPPKTAGNTT